MIRWSQPHSTHWGIPRWIPSNLFEPNCLSNPVQPLHLSVCPLKSLTTYFAHRSETSGHLSYEIASTRAGPPMDAPKSTLVDRTKPSGSRSHNPMPKKPPPRSQPPPRVATLLDSEAEAPEMPNLEMTDMRFEPVMKSTVLRYMYHVSVDGPALAVPTSVEDTTQSTNLAKLAYRESAKEFPNAPEEATNKVALIVSIFSPQWPCSAAHA